MAKIALGGSFIIPLGLAASTISSALGSVMVAPRTLQALASDQSFPLMNFNNWLARGRKKDNEPVNASLITVILAMVFVVVGNVNFVAEIISMFFMLTYGSLCLISFLNHFGSSPSYRPTFKSKWFLSLLGFVISVWVMFKINTPYAILAFIFMISLYLYINSYHKTRKGIANIFANTLFQLNKNLQIFIQKKYSSNSFSEWRPSAICISKDSFKRNSALKLLDWISYKYGFGTYLYRIDGYYSKATRKQAEEELERLIKEIEKSKNHTYVDTLVSPSYTSAIAQAIQIPGIAGMENNMVIFEYDKEKPDDLKDIIDNYSLVNAGNFDVCILARSINEITYHNGIHVWIRSTDTENANLLILLSFIISGHPSWKKSDIKIFDICKASEENNIKNRLKELVNSGRLPISSNNIEVIIENEDVSPKTIINKKSRDAGLTIIGFREEGLKKKKEQLFIGYDEIGTVLFVNSHNQKIIE